MAKKNQTVGPLTHADRTLMDTLRPGHVFLDGGQGRRAEKLERCGFVTSVSRVHTRTPSIETWRRAYSLSGAGVAALASSP